MVVTENGKVTFDPREHLMNFKGKEYLEVKWRLVWFEHEHPDGSIQSELVELDRDARFALFRATVSYPGGGAASDYGSETGSDFGDYIEKASTKAIGRALALMGYGTQFTDDYAMLNADGTPHVVDSPVERKRPTPIRQTTGGQAKSEGNWKCESCDKPIKGYTSAKGKTFTSAELVALSQRKHGKILCIDCAKAEQQPEQ